MHINLLIYVDFQNPLQIYYKYFEYARFLEKKIFIAAKICIYARIVVSLHPEIQSQIDLCLSSALRAAPARVKQR